MLVAAMAAHTEISKAHEVANQVRRIHKDLKDAQTDAAKYNNRERLFGLPVTNVRIYGQSCSSHQAVGAFYHSFNCRNLELARS